MDHGQRSARQAEHHAGEEAGHVHAKAVAHVGGGHACPEVVQVADAESGKPEYVVERVMPAERDEQAVYERVDTRAIRTRGQALLADPYQCAVNDRPYKEQDRRNNE